MTIWILNQASSIPGVPSGAHPSAGVQIEVDDANEVVSIIPLAQSPHIAPISDVPTADDTASEHASEATTPQKIEEA